MPIGDLFGTLPRLAHPPGDERWHSPPNSAGHPFAPIRCTRLWRSRPQPCFSVCYLRAFRPACRPHHLAYPRTVRPVDGRWSVRRAVRTQVIDILRFRTVRASIQPPRFGQHWRTSQHQEPAASGFGNNRRSCSESARPTCITACGLFACAGCYCQMKPLRE